MEKRCYGCKNEKLSQKDHYCLLITKEEWLHMFFDELLKEIDFKLINKLSENQVSEKFCQNEVGDAIEWFKNPKFSLGNEQWCNEIKNKLITINN